jgi:hypothetical protein
MLTPEFPKTVLKITRGPAGYDLMLKHPAAETVICLATVHDAADTHGPGVALAYANCLAAAFLMAHALDDMLEFEQPDGWGDDLDVEQANMWRRAFNALALAQGQPPGMVETCTNDNEPGP